MTQNYIYFGKRNRDIGVSAKLNHAPHYKTTVHNLKLLLGNSYEDANNEVSFLAYDIISLPDKSIGVKVNYLQDDIIFTVQQMTAIIFTKLKEIVENNLKIKAKECVISIPAFFNDNERRALLDSAKIAELDVLYLLHETTAEITSHDINSIHIIGGCTRIPFIRKIIQNIFNKEPTTTLNQDETIAKGCALKCALISPLVKTPNYDTIEICPFSIQLVWKSKNMERLGEFEIFKQQQKLPCSSIVTLMSNEPFILTAYTNENIEIGTFFIEEVIPIEGNNTKVDINIEINDIGLFSLKSAYLIEEKTSEEQNKLQLVKFKINNDDSIDYCKDVKQNNFYFVNQHGGINSIQEQQEKENFSQNENCFHPLKIRSVTANLTEELLSKYKQMEETMVNKDKMEKERIESKNSFEEYVYKMRENFFSESSLQHAMMKKVLDEAVNWLQNDGEDEEESIYYEKLEELKSYCEEFK